MAFTANQTMYTMYVIATVESNCTWTSVNYNDPITLGIVAATKHYVANTVQNAIELIGQNVVNAHVHKLEDIATLADVISAYNELVTVLAAGHASQLTTE